MLLAACTVFGGLGAFIIAKWGSKFSLLDKPNSRSSHKHATPKGGGFGILVAFVVCSFMVNLPLFIWVPATILALVSFYNDKYEISALIRLVIQFIAALSLLGFLDGAFTGIPRLVSAQQITIICLLSVFIVGTTNCYNFMDGINGIAAITGMVGFSLMGLYGLLSGKDANISLVSLSIAVSCAGFLPFNFPKARVFMGDVGSILLGFLFACIIIVYVETLFEFIILISFLFPFYADEVITQIERILRNEKLMTAHRRHLYQVLVNEHKISHWKISVSYGLIQLLVGLSIWGISGFGLLPTIFLLIVYFFCFVGVNRTVKSVYFY